MLAERGCRVELFEARRRLGGRAASFEDLETDALVDHCQHVAMGCCTNFTDFCQRTGIAHLFRCDRELHFFGPQQTHARLAAVGWLPAPLHLAPGLLRLPYLSWSERLGVARALYKLATQKLSSESADMTIGQWLREQNQSERAIGRFWEVVLVSALAESLDRASLRLKRWP